MAIHINSSGFINIKMEPNVISSIIEQLKDSINLLDECFDLLDTSYITGDLKTYYSSLGDNKSKDITVLKDNLSSLISFINSQISSANDNEEKHYKELVKKVDEIFNPNNASSIFKYESGVTVSIPSEENSDEQTIYDANQERMKINNGNNGHYFVNGVKANSEDLNGVDIESTLGNMGFDKEQLNSNNKYQDKDKLEGSLDSFYSGYDTVTDLIDDGVDSLSGTSKENPVTNVFSDNTPGSTDIDANLGKFESPYASKETDHIDLVDRNYEPTVSDVLKDENGAPRFVREYEALNHTHDYSINENGEVTTATEKENGKILVDAKRNNDGTYDIDRHIYDDYGVEIGVEHYNNKASYIEPINSEKYDAKTSTKYDSQGVRTDYSYDNQGNLVSERKYNNNNSVSAETKYDNGKVTSTTFYNNGSPAYETNGDGAVTKRYEYYSDNSLKTVDNQENLVSERKYNNNNSISAETKYDNGKVRSTTFYKNGSPAYETNGDGNVIESHEQYPHIVFNDPKADTVVPITSMQSNGEYTSLN